jgi:hypothetical protein
VALAFHGAPHFDDAEAAHRDGDQSNNTPGNVAWKTRAENEADKIAHGTLMIGSGHANSKINEDDVREIRRRRAAGEALKSIASSFQINFQNVSLICLRKTWAHVA